MAKFKEREVAIALRKEKQMSYSQIKKILKVSKGTLSLWLKDYPLSNERIKKLQKNERVIEKIRNTKRKKKERRLKEVYKTQKKLIFPLKKREFFMLGLGLYWGEGTKSRMENLTISNTDPSIINFYIYWLNKNLNIPQEKMKVQLHLYNDMNINKEIKFWSETLKVPLSQFIRPYIKKTSIKRINHKGSFGHGTCNLRINSVYHAEKILMSIKAISDKHNKGRVVQRLEH
jgi:transcriptional regulator with XRE-family HTH domain